MVVLATDVEEVPSIELEEVVLGVEVVVERGIEEVVEADDGDED